MMPNPIQEISDLFGRSRRIGLKAKVCDIERAIQRLPSILVPDQAKCLTLINRLEDRHVAASAPARIIKTLGWLATRTGTPSIHTAAIHEKLGATANRLIKELTKTHKRADAPPRDALACLEVACLEADNIVE